MAIESRHEAFARRLSTVWSTRAHGMVEIERVATDQVSMDDFASSMPVPTILTAARVDRLGATAYVQIDLPLALLFVERLLGGPGDAMTVAVSRKPTDLETTLIAQEVLQPIAGSIDIALEELPGEASTFGAIETAPQQLQLGAHGELLLMLTFRIEVRGTLPAQGLLTVAYPVTPLLNHLDALQDSGDDHSRNKHALSRVQAQLGNADVQLDVQLAPSAYPAHQIAALAEGDVLRLDHRAHDPAHLRVDGMRIGTGYLGRRGRRLAVQVDGIDVAQPIERPPGERSPGNPDVGHASHDHGSVREEGTSLPVERYQERQPHE